MKQREREREIQRHESVNGSSIEEGTNGREERGEETGEENDFFWTHSIRQIYASLGTDSRPPQSRLCHRRMAERPCRRLKLPSPVFYVYVFFSYASASSCAAVSSSARNAVQNTRLATARRVNETLRSATRFTSGFG